MTTRAIEVIAHAIFYRLTGAVFSVDSAMTRLTPQSRLASIRFCVATKAGSGTYLERSLSD